MPYACSVEKEKVSFSLPRRHLLFLKFLLSFLSSRSFHLLLLNLHIHIYSHDDCFCDTCNSSIFARHLSPLSYCITACYIWWFVSHLMPKRIPFRLISVLTSRKYSSQAVHKDQDKAVSAPMEITKQYLQHLLRPESTRPLIECNLWQRSSICPSFAIWRVSIVIQIATKI